MTIQDHPHVFELTLGSDSVDQYRTSLKNDFGCSHDHLHMNTRHLLNGPNSLDGILMLASHILDKLPDDHPEYAEFFSLFQKFCGALAQKVMNWKKVRQLSIHLFIIHHYINSPCRAQVLERPRKRHDPKRQHLYVSLFLQFQYTT